MHRRQFIQQAGSLLAATMASPARAATSSGSAAKVVVIGGGYAGATAAKYLRMWSAGAIEVTLVEPNPQFVSCPLSNLVIGGAKQIGDITVPYDKLGSRHGVRVVRDSAEFIDPDKRTVRLASGDVLAYDRLIVSPGIDFMWDELPGMLKAGAQEKILHGWKAGAQTVALRRQLEAMVDGGTYVLTIPKAPFRCPPAPYERACQVAHYFSREKKASRVLILDANDSIQSKPALFSKAWADRYAGIIEYRNNFDTVDIDATTSTAVSEFGDKVHGAVLNVVPPQRAGRIAVQAGLANLNKRWCEVDYLTFESTQAKNIHVLGDAIQVAPGMPKSGHMANQQGKVCAAAIIDLLGGKEPDRQPILSNTCYSFVSDNEAMHVASMHTYNAEKKTLVTVPGAGGLSTAANELEGKYAMHWALNIWADMLA